jgi:hypothetical protein
MNKIEMLRMQLEHAIFNNENQHKEFNCEPDFAINSLEIINGKIELVKEEDRDRGVIEFYMQEEDLLIKQYNDVLVINKAQLSIFIKYVTTLKGV